MKERKAVVIVEDEDGIRDILRLMIEMEGYPVHTAANGKEALDLLEKITPPGLIFLDLMMPVMNGWEFIEAIEGKDVLAQVPIVVITAFPEKTQSMPRVQSVIRKPISYEELLRSVREFCD